MTVQHHMPPSPPPLRGALQVPLIYQPEDSLYCVRAQYEPLDEDDLSVGLRVVNTANRGGVDGEPVGTVRLPGPWPN